MSTREHGCGFPTAAQIDDLPLFEGSYSPLVIERTYRKLVGHAVATAGQCPGHSGNATDVEKSPPPGKPRIG